MKYAFIALVVAFCSCTKLSNAHLNNQYGVRVFFINYSTTDEPLNKSFFSLNLNGKGQDLNLPTKFNTPLLVSSFNAISGDIINFNLDSNKIIQLGYIVTMKVIYGHDSVILYLNNNHTSYKLP